jgi:hypothetical protein
MHSRTKEQKHFAVDVHYFIYDGLEGEGFCFGG